MAGLAGDEFVMADQGELGEVVVEGDFPPAGRVVATLAAGVDARVGIIFGVAGRAGGFQWVGQLACMTA